MKNANPNGDPLNGNRPRTDIDGYGEISDVCIKRKIRNRMQDLGERIFVQSDERSDDGFKSLKERADGCEVLKKEIVKKKNPKGLNENIEVARRGGKIAGNARKDLEHEIGESVVTSNNSLNYEYVDEKEIEMR